MQTKNYLPIEWIENLLPVYETSVRATRSAISHLIREVRDAAKKYPVEDLSIFLVGLGEVITNIAKHSLKFQRSERIDISIYSRDNKYAVLVIDRAEPFDPQKKEPKSPKKQFYKGADSGYGMYMLKNAFAKIKYFPEKSKNVTVLLFDPKKIKLHSQ